MRPRSVVLATAAILVSALPALAHAHLKKSVPAAGASLNEAPKQVQLWYTEALQPKLSRVEVRKETRVVSSGRGHVDGKDHNELTNTVTNAGPGKYSVIWHVTSDDGHTTHGSFAFEVK